jgi:hypothetical protein
MIDCGATENFIDREYARQNQIPLLRKAVPRHCLAVDGTEVLGGPITHEALLHVTINNHEETVRLQCITIGNSSVILGLPWLRKHNPAIDWKGNRVSFNSEYCARKCLDTSPHAVTVTEDNATQEYFKRTPLDGELPEEVLSISMVDAETFSIESNDGTAGTITLKDINEILEAWELYHVIIADPVQKEALKKEATLKETIPNEYHEYLHLFDQKDPTELPPHRNHDHHIPLVDGKTAPFEAIGALDEKKLRALKEYIETNLKIGRIRPSKSPAGAPIHFALKKDGSLRLCVDYRGLNAITIKDRMPLPLISEALDRLVDAKIFTKLDIKDAYHNLRIAEGDEWKTAFRTKYGLFEYLVMPFGLTNAPASFQRWVNEILSEYLDVFCVAYLDDILIFSGTMEEHHKHVKLILQKMEEAGLILKASKCEFHTDRTEYLGYVISPSGIQMDHQKVRTVAEWKEPTNIKGVQSFLAFANFYRRFIKDYSKITLPLTRLTRKDTPWKWDDKAQEAFETLKAAITTEPILKHYDQEQPITLETDASDYAIGAVCSQPDETGALHRIGYYSRKLKDPKLNYDIHDKELLAIVDGLRKFDTYCKSTPHTIKILTDHKNLEYWQSKQDLILRQARWGERLADYDFVITYRPGKLAGKPDILSRESGDSPWEGEMKHRQNKERVLLPPEVFRADATEVLQLQIDHELLQKIKDRTKHDPVLQETIIKLQNGEQRDSKIALGLCEMRDDLLTYDSLIWVPDDDELHLKILHDCHDSQAAGHPGRAKTLELVSRQFYWPHQRKYVNRYVDNCDTCKRIKPIKHAPFGLLKPLEPPSQPWDSISMDFITGLPESEGSDTLWVVVDRLTKMAHFVPTSDTIKPEQLADAFITYLFRPHGLPNSIISDRGSLFTSSFWTHIMKALGTTRNLSTAFHPETDGQTERVNAILEQYLRAYCNYQQDNWKGLLPVAEFCYNNTQSGTTKVTPFFGNYGYHPRFLPDLEKADISQPEVSEYVSNLQKLHGDLRAEMPHAQMSHAEQANNTRHPDPVLRPGDKVWLRRKNIRTTRPSNKLDHKLIGPYTIIERIGTKAYKLNLPPTVRIHPVFHISLLEPVKNDSTPIPGHTQPPPPPVVVDNEEEWEVEEILDSRRHRNQLQYRVKWTGFHDPDRSSYPATNFEHAPEPVQKFHKKYPHKPAPVV